MTTAPVVDGADRRVAALYAFAAYSIAAVLVLASVPVLLGPVPWGWWLAGGALFAGLSTILPLQRKAYAAAAACATFWLTGAGWVAWGYAHDPFHHAGRYWLVGAALAGACTFLAYAYATPTDYGDPWRPPAPGPVPAAPGQPDVWAERIAAVSKGRVTGVHSVTVQDWDTGNGYTVYGTMPPDGSTWETLAPFEPGLAASLRLPAGGGVTVGPDLDGDAASFRVDVLRVDAMAGSMTYPGLEG